MVKRTAKENALTQITSKKADYVYNYVTQSQAAEQARGMYNESTFTSDLMNSYAWDTALVFIQKCGTNVNYSNQGSLNTILETTGTENDKQCNIYDMASNIYEWTTETCSYSNSPCVGRGGNYYNNHNISSLRGYNNTTNSVDSLGFRVTLYIK